MRDWRERRAASGYTTEELRSLVQEGIDSGPGEFSSMEKLKAAARQRQATGAV